MCVFYETEIKLKYAETKWNVCETTLSSHLPLSSKSSSHFKKEKKMNLPGL